ncbi:pyruvate dehydrogenase (acetyl-transferring) E1 component subunit alpha [Janibacter sp. G56]|uniref:pyruvate dehydrogenase (acetyl-transferring) E1 component subunit alpha n=1 Tax=Janibacter sp. G56 TaxID=3418717 RepID=UPI003CFFD991
MSDNEVADLSTDEVLARLHEPVKDPGDGGPEMVQLLTPEGQRLSHPRYDAVIDALSEDDLRSFYRDLVLVRRLDAEGYALQRQGELGLWPSLLGQEAAQVGSGRALRTQDFAFPTYREHGVGFTRGMDPLTPMSLFRGVSQGGCDPKANNFHLYTIVIGAQTLHATGYAMGVAKDGLVGTGDPDRDTAVIAYFGDGASAQGDVNEAFVYAASFDAPVVFFCQNNQWAISEPVTKQTRIPLYQRARGFGFPGVRVDGNDILAVYAVTKHYLDEARSGNGPLFIEAFTYRMGAHTTADDPTKYRIDAEVENWKFRDPILRFKTLLSREGIADEAYFTAIDAEADEFAARLREGVQTMPTAPGNTMWDHVYAEDHPVMEQERAAYEAYVASFEGAN